MTDFAINYSYYPDLERVIRSGKRVDDELLQWALDWHKGDQHPDFLVDYLHRLNRGEFPRKPGRPKVSRWQKGSRHIYMQCHYTGTLEWLKARHAKYGHITGLGYSKRDRLLLHFALNELAAMITAGMYLGSKSRYHTLQNTLSRNRQPRV